MSKRVKYRRKKWSEEVIKGYEEICKVFGRDKKMVYFEKLKLLKLLWIDEFKGNAKNEKYQCILVDVKYHKVIHILKDRTFAYLQSYFSYYIR